MIFAIVMGACAIVMFGIGVFQITRKTPIPFYTGENPPEAEKIKDVKAWNKKHGMLWIMYGLFIVAGIIAGMIVNSTVVFTIIEIVCVIVPLVFMVLYHKKLVRDYIIS